MEPGSMRVSASSRGIDSGNRRAGLQGDYTAGLPPAQRFSNEAIRMSEEGKLVHPTGDETMSPIEIREAAGIAGNILVVDTSVKGDGRCRDIVDRLGIRVVALEIQSLRKMVGQG